MCSDPLVSVVVPAYNVEQYIEKCLKSICNQTYSNLQIIVVDDGSIDNTGSICDRIALEDYRTIVVHQTNHGVVAARAAGAREAKGKYIAFVDGDDCIDSEMVKFMVDNIGDCELVTTGVIREVNAGYKVIRSDEFDEGIYDGENLKKLLSVSIYNLVTKTVQPLTPWLFNKLFKTDLMIDIIINENPQLSYGEDSVALYQYLLKCKSIHIQHKALYTYRFRNESAIHKEDIHAIDKIAMVYEELTKCFSANNDVYGFVKQAKHWFVVSALGAINERIGFGNEIHIPRYVPNTDGLFGKKLILYAAGRVGKDYYRFLNECGYEIVAWVDKNYKQYGDYEYSVSAVWTIRNIKYDYIYIAVEQESIAKAIGTELQAIGVIKEQILWRKPVILY